ncbi:MAG: SAM-dependent methyltransferase [Firmicutes bacterium]|nr:SAM-dependent methyltransferase [Bacillota bacterium]
MKTDILLSPRLELIAQLVKGNIAADIGTDHGFVPIRLLLSGKCQQVILADINEGPLQKAKENLQAYSISPDMAPLRLGSGLQVLSPYEADTVIIAGMGGELIAEILAEEPAKNETFARFILQPRTKEAVLRRWLLENGFYITDERLVEERDRICQVLVAEPVMRASEEAAICAERIRDGFELQYPPFWFLRESERQVLKRFAQKELKRLENLLCQLQRSSDRDAVADAIRRIRQDLQRLTAILSEIFPNGWD